MLSTRLINYLLVAILGFIHCANADELKIYTEHLPPYQYQLDGKISGIATDKVKALLSAAQLPHHIVMVPWARAYTLAKSQKDSLIFSINRTAERENQFHWLAVVASIHNSFVALRERGIRLASVDDIKYHITAVVRDGYAYSYLQALGFREGENLLLVSSIDEQMHLLLNRKIDLLFTELNVVNYKLHSMGLASELAEEVLTDANWQRDLYLAAGKHTSRAIIEKIKAANAVLP